MNDGERRRKQAKELNMQRTSIRFRFFIAVAAMAVLAPTLLFAGPGRGGGFGNHGMHGDSGLRGLHQLDLSEEQREQLHEALSARREEGAEARQELREARIALMQAIHAETLDEGAIRAASQRVSTLEEDQAVERALIFQEVRKILTAEQLEELQSMRQERRERRQGRRGPRGGGPAEGVSGE